MNDSSLHKYHAEAINLLSQIIATPSLSREEGAAADLMKNFLSGKGVEVKRNGNNVWCINKYFDRQKPTILLNSHLDTVPASAAYTQDPHKAITVAGNLYGLGSTDAGGSLVCLAITFIHFYECVMSHNIVFAATAEEEISGANGIENLFACQDFRSCFNHSDSFAILGEPTQLELGIAEKGLMVLDCEVAGKAGHAARNEGENAIYKALYIIDWFKNFKFEKVSPLLGEVKMTVTDIRSGNTAHNVVPALCNFVVDVRLTEQYTHDEVLAIICMHVDCEVRARSKRLKSSGINFSHPIVQAGMQLGKNTFGSQTLSDQALIPLPCLKCGPGNSAQSHTADEFIAVQDLYDGIAFYKALIESLVQE